MRKLSLSNVRRYPVLATTLLLLITYHALNLGHRDGYRTRSVTRPARLTLARGDRELFSLPTSVRAFSYPYAANFAMDFTSRKLADMGALLKFWGRNTGDRVIVNYAAEPPRFYLDEEIAFQFRRSDAYLEEHYLRQIRDFLGALAGKVSVFVVPVPTKLSVERSRFPDFPARSALTTRPDEPEDPYANYRRIVKVSPAHVVDLHDEFSRWLARRPADELFIPMDTHWSPLGIAVAARRVVSHVKAAGIACPDVPDFAPVRTLATPLYFDLAGRLNVVSAYFRTWRRTLYDWQNGARPARFSGRILWAGTSYSDQLMGSGYSLPELVARALGRPLVRSPTLSRSRTVRSLSNLWDSGVRPGPDDILFVEMAVRLPWNPDEIWPLPPSLVDN